MPDDKDRHLLVINGDHEQVFRDFYRDIHLPEIVGVAGFLSATHLERSAFQLPAAGDELHKYLTVIEIEGDLAAAFAQVAADRAAGRVTPIDHTGRGASTFALFSQLYRLPRTT